MRPRGRSRAPVASRAATAGGTTLRLRTPRPSSSGTARGSAASSPHTDTGTDPASLHRAAISRSTPGSRPSASSATDWLPRSAASAYWVRSLVPTLKKSTCGTKAAAFKAADGTSTMMPIRNESGRPPTSAIAASTNSSRRHDFRDCRDHREHHADRMIAGDCAHRDELIEEHVGWCKRQANTAFAEERIRFGRLPQERQRLVAADVEGAQHDSARVQILGDSAVDTFLFVATSVRRSCRRTGTRCAPSLRHRRAPHLRLARRRAIRYSRRR